MWNFQDALTSCVSNAGVWAKEDNKSRLLALRTARDGPVPKPKDKLQVEHLCLQGAVLVQDLHGNALVAGEVPDAGHWLD